MTTLTGLITLIAQAAPTGQAAGGDQQWMVYAIIAFGAALALMVVEAFVPSGGVLGILAGLLAVGGIVMFFRFDTMWGIVSMGVTLLATPFLIAGMLWLWPNTPVGRALTLEESQKRVNEEGPPDTSEGAIVVGIEGEALTELRPVGSCKLGGKRIDCIAHAGMIKAGTKVRVVRVDGMSVKVKAV